MKKLLLITITILGFLPVKVHALTCGFGSDVGDGISCRGYLTATTTLPTFIVPSDWGNASNTIEVIGGGASGGTDDGASGAGGGAYSKIVNQTLTGGSSVTYQVGAGGPLGTVQTNGGDTWFCNSTSNCTSIAGSAVIVGAKGGGFPTGGAAASGVGTTKYSGGNGGSGAGGQSGGGGGGGAAGPQGDGKNGGNVSYSTVNGGGGGGAANNGSNGADNSGTAGGAGGNNRNGTGGGSGGPGFGGSGSCGTDGGGGGGGGFAASYGYCGSTDPVWDSTHGPGSAGGGGSAQYAKGGPGADYGGGGGGNALVGSSDSQPGGSGIIVITYEPQASAPAMISRLIINGLLRIMGQLKIN